MRVCEEAITSAELTSRIHLARSYSLLENSRSCTQCANCWARVENRKNHLAWHQGLQGPSVSAPWPGQTTEKTDAWHAANCPPDTTRHPGQGGRVPGCEPKNPHLVDSEGASPSGNTTISLSASPPTLNSKADGAGWKITASVTHGRGIRELEPTRRSLGNN